VLTVLFFTHDNKGVFNGIIKARIYLNLAEDLKSYDSVAERRTPLECGPALRRCRRIDWNASLAAASLPHSLTAAIRSNCHLGVYRRETSSGCEKQM
jgi:hypothetical protein